MSGMNHKGGFGSVEPVGRKVGGIERQGPRGGEIQQEFQSDDLMDQFKKLEYKGTADQQLLDLKAKMGMLSAGTREQRALGAGGKKGEAEIVQDEGETKH